MPDYITLGGIHELGSDSSQADIRTERADGWSPHLKVVASATHARNLSPEFADDAIRVMRWWVHNGYRSDHIGAWIGDDNPVSSAKRWVNHMRAELDILASTGRVWYVETMNEVGVSRTLCQFDAAVGIELKRIYGDQIRVAALSMSSGSFNDQHNWDLMIDYLIKPLNAAGVKFALSFHCYSSWLPIVGNFPGKQHAELAPRFPNISWQEMGMESVPPFDINYDGPRYDWTGFAVESMIRYFHKHGVGNTPLVITEQDIDMMGPVGHGSAGGHYEWNERGYYDFLKTQTGWDVDTLIGHGLWYAERRYRAVNKGGGNILAVFWFTWGDQDRFSRWYRHYRHKGGPANTFKFLARTGEGIEQPEHQPPAFPPHDPENPRVWVRTMTITPVNVRPTPSTSQPAIASLDPTKTYVATHIVKNGADVWLRVDYGFHTYGWAAYIHQGAQITDISDPLPALPLWGGGPDANDDTWMHDEPTNGGDMPDNNLMGFKIENQPTIEKLRPMMTAFTPDYCTVVVDVGEAAYIASLAQAFPETTFGVLFDFSIDFGETVHERPATPGDFAPLYNAATTREAGQTNFNANAAWQRWRDGTNANGKKLIADFQHLAALPTDVRRRILIMSFFELPTNDDVLTPAYIAFEKERMIQMAFDYGLGAIVLNHRGQHMDEAYFALVGKLNMGMHLAIKTTNDQLGHQESSIGRTDDAGLLFELLHGPVNQQASPDGKLARHPKEMVNQTPVYEAGDFHGLHQSKLALKILPDHHRINEHLPMPSVPGGIPVRITSFGYRGDSGETNYRHYHSQGKRLDGYHDNKPVWESWGLDPVTTLKQQLAYAPAQISKVPQVKGIAFDNLFGGGVRDISGVAVFEDNDPPEPEPEAVILGRLAAFVGEGVTFSAGHSPGQITSYMWGIDGPNGSATYQTKAVTHHFIAPGVYVITLRVDGPGGTHTAQRDITISAPDAPPPPPETPRRVEFSGRIMGIIPFTGVVEMS